MGKKQKSKARLDKFYYLAKEHGFRSRAAFKLIQLNKKYRFLESANCLIDLCAAPGGWLQVASKYMPVSSIKIGIDLDPIKSIPGVISFQADITSEKCRFLIKKEIKHFKADIVLNDGAPNVGGQWSKDAYNQSELVLFALKLATEFLKEGGIFITKVFRSSDYNSLMYVLKQLFDKVDATKPQASRNESAEIFVVCQGYKAPGFIDPKLMDPKFALNQVEDEEEMKLNSMKSIKAMFEAKKSRGGYTTSSLYNAKTFKDFIECSNPYQFLFENNKILVKTDDCNKYLNLAKKPDDYDMILDDLKVLGKKEIRDLIIWRHKIKSKLSKSNKPERENKKSEKTEENYEEIKLNEIDKELEGFEKEKKKKLLQNKRKKEKNDLKQKLNFINDAGAANNDGVDFDQELFDFLKTNEVDIEELPDDAPEEEQKNDEADEEIDLSEISETEEIERLNDEIEENMEMFQEEKKIANLNKKITNKENKKIKKLERIRLAEEEENKKLEDGDDDDNIKTVGNDNDSDDSDLSDFSDEDDDAEDKAFFENPLRNASLKNKKKIGKEEVTEESKEDKKAKIPEKDEEDILSSDTDEELDKPKKKKKFDEAVTKKPKVNLLDDNSDTEDKEYTLEDKAEIRAIAKKMLRKKNRIEILNSSYNRYAFDDLDDAPKWFFEDENKHNKPSKPVTKEEVMEEKAALKEVNSKMPKKVLEAKNRKKRQIALKMQKVKRKAETIFNQEEMNEKSKISQIEKLYKKELSKFKEKKKYVVGKKYQSKTGKGAKKGGRNTKFVDRRLKKDKRGQNKMKDKKKK